MTGVDVLVVGSGAAGLTAALAAQEAGARVLVVEAEEVLGGATRAGAGMILAAGTDVQRRHGLVDDAGAFYQEYLLYYRYELVSGIAARVAFDGAATISWLMGLGVEFPEVIKSGAERVPRGHLPLGGPARGGGQYLIDVLAARCRERGIEMALGRRVDRLVRDGDVVTGLAIGDDELPAGAVVLANGGFGANPELIERYLPTVAREGDRVFYMGPDSSRGDAFALVEPVGASIVGFDRSAAALQPNTEPGSREWDPYLPPWVVVVGPDGRRVFDESNAPYGGTYAWVTASGGSLFALFDARSRADNGSRDLPTFRAQFGGEPMRGLVWVPEGIDRMVAAGGIVVAETLEALAEALGLPVQALLGSVARYNESVAQGEDRDFLKDPRFLRAVEQPPFYGAELRPLVLSHTACGPQIDETGQVLDQDQRAIGGLFAAGECTGGVIGPGYIGGGNSLAICTVFGRAAGRSAAAYALGSRADP